MAHGYDIISVRMNKISRFSIYEPLELIVRSCLIIKEQSGILLSWNSTWLQVYIARGGVPWFYSVLKVVSFSMICKVENSGADMAGRGGEAWSVLFENRKKLL